MPLNPLCTLMTSSEVPQSGPLREIRRSGTRTHKSIHVPRLALWNLAITLFCNSPFLFALLQSTVNISKQACMITFLLQLGANQEPPHNCPIGDCCRCFWVMRTLNLFSFRVLTPKCLHYVVHFPEKRAWSPDIVPL